MLGQQGKNNQLNCKILISCVYFEKHLGEFMGKEQFNQLKEIIEIISTVIEKYPESLKEIVFHKLIAAYNGDSFPNTDKSIFAQEHENETSIIDSNEIKSPRKKLASKVKSGGFKIDSALVLKPGEGKKSFSEFFTEKSPKSNSEFIAVSVYYLSREINLAVISYDQIFTCFKEVGKRPPDAFKQAFIDTKNKQGWIDVGENGILTITHRGATMVEFDLPKKTNDKKK